MLRNKKWIIGLSATVITAFLLCSYELFRYKGDLYIDYHVQANEDASFYITFEMFNKDWRASLTSWSIHIRDDKNEFKTVEVLDPARISCQRETFSAYSIFFAKLPNDFTLKPKNKKTVTILVSCNSSENTHVLEGYFRMVGSTGDGLVKGQHSNSRFRIDLTKKETSR